MYEADKKSGASHQPSCPKFQGWRVREHVAQFEERPTVPALDRVHRSADYGGDLVKGHLLAVMQQEDRSMIGVELIQSGVHYLRHGSICEDFRGQWLRILQG